MHSGGSREAILALRYGYVDIGAWVSWKRLGCELHVLARGEDLTQSVREFTDEPEAGRCATLYRRRDITGAAEADAQGRPLVDLVTGFLVVPAVRSPSESFAAFPDDQVWLWLGMPSVEPEPLPRRALRLRDDGE